jgi:hypothetical protein
MLFLLMIMEVSQSTKSAGQVKGANAIGPAILFAQTGLDGTQQHTIQITYGGKGDLGGGFLAFFGIMYASFSGSISANIDSSSLQLQ